jgi:hypothetical protein
VAIDIRRHNLVLFRCVLPGATSDQEEWIRRKSASVLRFEHSTALLSEEFAARGHSPVRRGLARARGLHAGRRLVPHPCSRCGCGRRDHGVRVELGRGPPVGGGWDPELPEDGGGLGVPSIQDQDLVGGGNRSFLRKSRLVRPSQKVTSRRRHRYRRLFWQ